MTLLREQIDVLLESMEATAHSRHRANPGDPALARDLVAQTRALLRTVDLKHHLRICDHVQQLLLNLDAWNDDVAGELPMQEPVIQHAATVGGPVAKLDIPLMDNPFDLDAFSDEGAAPPQGPAEDRVAAAVRQAIGTERRRDAADEDLRAGLTPKQLATLDTMAVFGWKLEFVRRPMFMPPQPVAFDRNRERFVVVDEDGNAEEDATVRIRR